MRKHFAWLVALGLALTLAGCGKNAAASTTNSNAAPTVTALGKSGVVSKAQLTKLAQSGHNFSFTGKTSDGIKYKWTYTAAQVKNPTKQKLGITLTTKHQAKALKAVTGASDVLSFKLKKFDLAASPELTITIPKHWSATAAVLLSGKKFAVDADTPVHITRNANSTQLKFRVTSVNKTVYLVGTSKANKTKAVKKAEASVKTAIAKKTSATKAKAKNAQNSGSSATTSPSSSASAGQSSSSSKSSTKAGSSSKDAATSAGNSKTATTAKSTATKKTTTTSSSAPTVTISISAATAARHLSEIDASKRAYVPANGWILAPTKVTITAGESVYDVLKRVTAAHGIQMESRYTPAYNAYYVSGINNLYEFDGGSASGWMYAVNGWFPNYGASASTNLKNGDVIKWVYTLELGQDVGAGSW
jgi:hypothetical protein